MTMECVEGRPNMEAVIKDAPSEKIEGSDEIPRVSWATLGCSSVAAGNFELAHEAFDKFLQSPSEDKENPIVWYAIGLMYFECEDYVFAVKSFQTALEVLHYRPDPKFKDVSGLFFRLGICYRETKNFEKALKCFESAYSNPPSPMTTADVLFHVAVTYEGMGNHTAARKFYNKLLVSKNYTVLQQLMALEINSLNSSSSLDNLETIVNLVETLTEVPSQTSRFKAMLILVLARVSFSKKLYDDSFALLQFAEQIDGTLPQISYFQGLIHSLRGNVSAAVHSFKRTVSLNPDLATVWIELAGALENIDLPVEALEAYRTAYKLIPHERLLRAIHSLESRFQLPMTKKIHL